MTSAAVAARLVGTWAAHGLRHVVVSPGSRSTPLALACAHRGDLEVHVVIDERSAAFFALGLARGEGAPVLLVCTSGSAPAHYHPAIVEAYEDGVPLIVASADRPARLHACGAPQTTNQRELFGSHVVGFWHVEAPEVVDSQHVVDTATEAWTTATAGYTGPVHVNVAFDEPLAQPPERFELVANASDSGRGVPVKSVELPAGDGVIVAGPRAQVPVDDVLAVGVPVLADPLSNLRSDSRTISTYDAWLRSPRIASSVRPDWVVRIGRPPTSKALGQWLASLDAPQWVLDPYGKRFDPFDTNPRFLAGAVLSGLRHNSSRRFLEYVDDLERSACAAIARFVEEAELFEGTLLSRLARSGGLFAASSMPIRDVDTFLTSGRPLRVFANRGVNGIDGQVSTAAGLAAAGAVQVAVVGDLAALHDLSGFALARRHDLCVVVVQNHGGGIFEYLPVAGTTEHFEELFVTPHAYRFESIAQMFDLPYQRVSSRDGLEMLEPRGLIEVEVPRARSVELHRALWSEIEASCAQVPRGLRRTA